MDTERFLINTFAETGIAAKNEQIQQLTVFLNELKKWNRSYNLTALRTERDIIVKHFIDSLLYLKVMPEQAKVVADAGSGAGFPGIPLKIMKPALNVSLIESSRKKSSFLRHIIRTLDLKKISVQECRCEDLGSEFKNRFDMIVSRATFSIKRFLQVACPYVKQNGAMILSKGPNVYSELRQLQNFPELKEAVREIHKFDLPCSGGSRNLLLLKCVLQ